MIRLNPDDPLARSLTHGPEDPSAKMYVTLEWSLRDYFAGQALSKFSIDMATPANPQKEAEAALFAARCAYAIADAMLLERTKDRP